MKYRIGILALSLFLSEETRPFALAAESKASVSTATASVLVWVRDSRGAPVSGLKANDFLISESGIQNRVIAVRSFAPPLSGAQASTPSPDGGPGVRAPAPLDELSDVRSLTEVLLVITPMGPRGRRDSLRDAIRLLDRPVAADWRLALIDDEGTFVPFGHSVVQMRDILVRLATRSSAPQYEPLFGGTWTPKAARAIRELGVQPGRHVIVCVSDYDSKSEESVKQNPTLLRVSPDVFIGEAVSAQAAMYTVEGNGPAVAVPFGSAAYSPSSGSYEMTGQDVANAMVQDIVKLGAERSDLLQAADETGGLPIDSLKDAFKRIAADAAGYYLITFETQPNNDEGSLHPFSISTRFPHFRVNGPSFYLSPHDPRVGPLPADMKAALDVPANRIGLNIAVKSWLFPNQGLVHWGVFAADVRFQQGTPAPGSRVKIYAELVNNSMAGVADAWSEVREWTVAGSAHPLHWQREGYIYPGSYTLRVTAMDVASGKISKAEDPFLVQPLSAPAFRFGPIVLADRCLPDSEQQTMRRNLFDPLRWGSCKLAPAASETFGASQTPLLLLRIYPPDPRLAETIMNQWKAYAVVDDADDKAINLQISPAEVRGLTVTGKLPFESFKLAPGHHDLKVLLTIQGRNATTRVLPLRTTFSIEP